MSRIITYVPRALFFLAGVAAAAIALPRRERAGMDRNPMDRDATEELKKSLANLEARLQTHQAADNTRIVSAVEELLSRTMALLDERLTTQAHSIEVLKATVSQTDNLLGRVLESLDSLESLTDPATDPADFAEDSLLSRPAV